MAEAAESGTIFSCGLCAVCVRLHFSFLGHLALSDPESAEHRFVEKATRGPVADIEEGKA
jgi:hypothetical protein